jgi:hypothetical protein
MAALFHGRPRRFVLPLKPRPGAENQIGLIAAYIADPDYAAPFHGRPRRFVLPLKPRPGAENQIGLIAAYIADPDYAAPFHGRSRRFVLPLKPRPGAENQLGFIAAYTDKKKIKFSSYIRKFRRERLPFLIYKEMHRYLVKN